eukprot:RCo046220
MQGCKPWPLLFFFTNLTTLSMRGNKIGDAGILAFAASAVFPKLKGVDLSCNLIGDTGVEAMMASVFFPSLAFVAIRENRISDIGTQMIATSRFCSAFSSWFLYRACEIKDEE